jgi:uncharacterized protein YbjQ (UPF0145 family)
MIVVTTEAIAGRRVERVLGLVRGNTIRASHFGEDIMAHLRNAAGGEIVEYTKMLAEAREQAIDRMIEDARALGADAILAVRFESVEMMTGAAELLCYGTAVTLAPEPAR